MKRIDSIELYGEKYAIDIDVNGQYASDIIKNAYQINTVNSVTNDSTVLTVDGKTPIYLISTTSDIESLSLSNNPNEGRNCRIIFRSTEKHTVTVKYDAVNRICSDGRDFTVEIPVNGYAEIEFITVNGNVYVRAVTQSVTNNTVIVNPGENLGNDDPGNNDDPNTGGGQGDTSEEGDKQYVFSVDSESISATAAPGVRTVNITSTYGTDTVDYTYTYDGNISSVEKTESGIQVNLEPNTDTDHSVTSTIHLSLENSNNEITVTFVQSKDKIVNTSSYTLPAKGKERITSVVSLYGDLALFSSDGSQDEFINFTVTFKDESVHPGDTVYESGTRIPSDPYIYRTCHTSTGQTYQLPSDPHQPFNTFTAYHSANIPVSGSTTQIPVYESTTPTSSALGPLYFTLNRSFNSDTNTWDFTLTYTPTGDVFRITGFDDNIKDGFTTGRIKPE